MSRKADIVVVLGRHIDRPIRAFLADRMVQGTAIEEAFWDAVYLNDPEIPFDRAVALVSELECSPKRVGALLEGWRPQAAGTEFFQQEERVGDCALADEQCFSTKQN